MRSLGFEALFTSPYSPEWNPAEMAFSLLKRRHNNQSFALAENVEETIEILLREITQSNCLDWMKHCWGNIKANWHR